MELLVEGINEFSFDLFQRIYASNPANLVFSSFSILMALTMTLAGSNHETKLEILKTLKLDKFFANQTVEYSAESDVGFLHEHIRLLSESIVHNDNSTNKLVIANKMIVNDQKIETSFRDLIENTYRAGIDSVDAKESFKSIVQRINEWISELTNNKLNNVLGEDFNSASLALINVIYFNYEWLYQFDKNHTSKEKFYRGKLGESVLVEMMRINEKTVPYSFSDKLAAHILSLPYKEDKFQFTVVLPEDKQDFLLANDTTSLIHRLSFASLTEELKKQSFRSISLEIPRFTIKKDLILNQVLQSLGIRSAFDRSKADLSGISQQGNLFIDKIIQQAFIEVNEKGTEAAAVTVVKIVKRSLVHSLHIKLNRPFIYLISEKKSGLAIFYGSYNGDGNQDQQNMLQVNKEEL